MLPDLPFWHRCAEAHPTVYSEPSRGYWLRDTKDCWSRASAEEKKIINHYLIYYLNIIKIIHNHYYWIQDLDNIKILEAVRLRRQSSW